MSDTDTVDAVVVRKGGMGHAGEFFAHEAVIKGVPSDQFEDWRAIGFVARATAAQVAAHDAAEAAARGVDIQTAVAMLDHNNDEHWTATGLPVVDLIAQLTGHPVTRARITAAAPEAKRAAKPQAGQSDGGAT